MENNPSSNIVPEDKVWLSREEYNRLKLVEEGQKGGMTSYPQGIQSVHSEPDSQSKFSKLTTVIIAVMALIVLAGFMFGGVSPVIWVFCGLFILLGAVGLGMWSKKRGTKHPVGRTILITLGVVLLAPFIGEFVLLAVFLLLMQIGVVRGS